MCNPVVEVAESTRDAKSELLTITAMVAAPGYAFLIPACMQVKAEVQQFLCFSPKSRHMLGVPEAILYCATGSIASTSKTGPAGVHG